MKRKVFYFIEGCKTDVESLTNMLEAFVGCGSVAFIKDEFCSEICDKGVFVIVFDDIPSDSPFPTYEVINSMCKWKNLRFLSDVLVK